MNKALDAAKKSLMDCYDALFGSKNIDPGFEHFKSTYNKYSKMNLPKLPTNISQPKIKPSKTAQQRYIPSTTTVKHYVPGLSKNS